MVQQQSQKITSTPTPPPPTSIMPQSPVPLTIIQEDPTAGPAPMTCPDATDVHNPLGRLRSAMRNSAYTQMNAFFDAFIIFYTDEHLVRICHLLFIKELVMIYMAGKNLAQHTFILVILLSI